MIWFSSDFHYYHKNITRGVSVWDDIENTTRDFQTVKEMSDALVNSINKYVQQNDTLYFLGDWSFSGIENIYNFWKRLICKNIIFIPGNHDKFIKGDYVLPNCKRNVYYSSEIIDGKSIGGEIPDYVISNSLFDYRSELISIIINKQKFILSHYPIEQWEDMDKGSIMLHGHCHHKIDNCETNIKYKRMDVGIDWKEFRPYSLDEILEIMSKREINKHIS